MCGSNGARGTFTWRLGQDEHHQLVHNPLVIAWFQILTSKVLGFLKGSGRLRNSIFSLQEIWINSKLVKLLDKYASKLKKKSLNSALHYRNSDFVSFFFFFTANG